MITLAGLPPFLFTQTSAWNAISGDWEATSSWTPRIVPLDTALFNNPLITGAQSSIPLGTTVTIGHIEFSAGQVVITSSGGPPNGILQFSANPFATLDVTGGSSSFDSIDFSLLSDLVITNTSAATLSIANSSSWSGDGNLTINQGAVDISSAGFSIGGMTLNDSTLLTLTVAPTGNITFLAGSGDFQTNTLSIASSISSTYSGSLTSTRLEKGGSGILTLSGNNGIRGINISGVGGISVSTAENLGFPTDLDFAGGTLFVTGNTPFTYTSFDPILIGALSTGTFNIGPDTSLTLNALVMGEDLASTLIKTGMGTLIIPSVVETITVIDDGTLLVTGQIGNSTTVNDGGTLEGTGILQNVVVNDVGILRPGNPLGTMDIAGTLTLEPNALTQIEITPTEAAKVVVSGPSVLGGSVQVIQENGSYPLSGSYPIMQLNGGFSGFFNSAVLGGLQGFHFNLSLSGSTVFLNYLFSGLPLENLTGPAKKFAQYLNTHALSSEAMQLLVALPADELQQALESASPLRNGIATFATQDIMFAWNNLLANHLLDQRFYLSPSKADFRDEKETSNLTANASDKILSPPTCTTHSFWVAALGEYAHQNSINQVPAFHYGSGGGIFGIDFFDANNLVGFGIGGASTSLHESQRAGHVDIMTYFITAYDTIYNMGNFPLYLEFGLWGVYNQIDNARHIIFPGTNVTAKASFNSWELVPHFAVGYLVKDDFFSFDPFAQFDLPIDWQQTFHESGAGPFNVKQDSHLSEFLRCEGGIRFYQTKQTSWGSWMVMEKASYVNKKAFGTGSIAASIVGTTSLFNIETFNNVQNLGSIGLEFLSCFGNTKPATISLTYNGEFGSRYWSQEMFLRFTKDF